MLLLPASLLIATLATADAPSLEHEIGQLIMVGFRGVELAEDARVLRDIRDRHVGGVVLYSYDVPGKSEQRNIENPRQLRRLIRQLQSVAEVPLLIAIDQEGGRVRRLQSAFGFGDAETSAARFGRLDDTKLTAEHAARTAETMAALGLNLNFAPVVDLDINPHNPAIGRHGRSYGKQVDKVVRHAVAVIDAHHRHGVLTVLKHFPGQGSAREDSHFGLPDVSEVWRPVELQPFARLIALGKCDAVMTAHLYNGQLDKELPATLSQRTITTTLRGELGFDGVVITDDMQMHSITKRYGEARAVKLALEAGADILIFANNWVYDEKVTERVIVAIKNMISRGELDRRVIDAAYQRVKALKARLASPAREQERNGKREGRP